MCKRDIRYGVALSVVVALVSTVVIISNIVIQRAVLVVAVLIA